MNRDIPTIIGSANVIYWTEIDERHQRTGNTTHYVNGNPFIDVRGLAICQYDGESGFYLFYCNENWEDITDTFHESIEDAIDQVEFEFKNASTTIIKTKD